MRTCRGSGRRQRHGEGLRVGLEQDVSLSRPGCNVPERVDRLRIAWLQSLVQQGWWTEVLSFQLAPRRCHSVGLRPTLGKPSS